jgi:hypothetical protein
MEDILIDAKRTFTLNKNKNPEDKLFGILSFRTSLRDIAWCVRVWGW